MQESVSSLETICHPRSASLNLESVLNSEDITEIADKLTKVHTLVISSTEGIRDGSGHSEGIFKINATKIKDTEEGRKRTSPTSAMNGATEDGGGEHNGEKDKKKPRISKEVICLPLFSSSFKSVLFCQNRRQP